MITWNDSQKQWPKVTVITVSFNNVDVAEATLCSLLALDYTNLEYIVVDNESRDGTLELINKYKSRIDRLIVEPDTGPYDAMNKGVRAASGDWIIFMNMGDCFPNDPQLLRKIFINQIPEAVGILYGNTEVVRAGFGYRLEPDTKPDGNLRCGILTLNHQSLLCRRMCFERFGYFEQENFPIRADACWLTSILKKAGPGFFSKTDQLLAIYNEEGMSSLTSNFSSMYREDRKILKRYGSDFNLYQLWIRHQIMRFRMVGLIILTQIRPVHNFYRRIKYRNRNIHTI